MDKMTEQNSLPGVAPPEKMFYKIRDVAKIADVKPHVLRYWESEFPNLSPTKNKNGQRVYSRRDVELVLTIKRLLHVERYSIAGAKQFFKRKRGPQPAPEQQPEIIPAPGEMATLDMDVIRSIRDELISLREMLLMTGM